MELDKIVNFLRLSNVDELADFLGKSRATVYRYGKPEDDPGFSEPPYGALKALVSKGVPIEYLFGIPCSCKQETSEAVTRTDIQRMIRDELRTELEFFRKKAAS